MSIQHLRTRLDPLDRVGWLAEQSESFRTWVAEAARWREFDAGQFLFQAGDPADGLYGLASGSLELTFPLVAEEPVMIYRAEIGFWIGDNAELADEPRLVSVMAAEHSRVLHLPSHAIRSHLAVLPEDWQAFYRLSSKNVRMAIMALSEALALTVRARVCRCLLRLAERPGHAAITQEDLAKLIGVTRTTLRQVLAQLVEAGAVEVGYRRVLIRNRDVLLKLRNEQ
ncbi:Crp/Fnr family transcriptional regulator [Alsobacter sp. R-9]